MNHDKPKGGSVMEQKKLEWLKEEMKRWVEEGIITSEQNSRIEALYPAGRAASPLLVLFAILGSLLIGAGIILIFATNWWSLPVEVRLTLAFLPLILGQGICLYTFRRRYHSASFREGGAVFLSLSFFATLALVGQVFHTSSDMGTYLLVCILFTLPGVYLFRARAAMTIYIFGAVFVSWSWPGWVSLVLLLIALPFFYMEAVKPMNHGGLNYLLFLLSILVTNTIWIAAARELAGIDVSAMEGVLICGLFMLLIDILFRRVGTAYFFTAAKFFSVLYITAAILISSFDISYSEYPDASGIIAVAVITAAYLALRLKRYPGILAGDLFLASAIVLLLTAEIAGITACILALGLGVYYIVQGSRMLALRKLNYGMVLVILLILIRFFDSSLGLFGRGIVFILLGAAFLGINLYISRKRKELQK